MQRLIWSSLDAAERKAALARPEQRRDGAVEAVVKRIFDEVEAEGFDAVRRWSRELDKREPRRLELSAAVIDAARARVEPADIEALDLAAANVLAFHRATAPKNEVVETQPGVRCRREWRPIPVCGLYAPGGSAPLFSTLLMLAGPARVAGVREIVALTPPDRSGEAHPMMIAAAAACGLDALWLLGGAQAIAALTFGAGLPKADKVFGPGNAYVAEAKRYAASLPGGPQIDTPAGPSELLVIADAGARAELVAADLLSQAEHDADAQVVLVATDEDIASAVERDVERQLQSLPRAEIARRALEQGRVFIARDAREAAAIANAYAPEHLSLQVRDAGALLPEIENAGAVFLGAGSAETFGDYTCGPSHVLPTDGAARACSGVSVASFMKCLSVMELDAAGVARLAPATARLARLEGLEAHARAADFRET